MTYVDSDPSARARATAQDYGEPMQQTDAPTTADATPVRGCTICEATLAAVGRAADWRIYGTVRPLTGSGDAVIPPGQLFVFCPDCAAGVEPTNDMAADMERLYEVVRRSPHPATDAGYRSQGRLLARIILTSTLLTPGQVPAFHATYE